MIPLNFFRGTVLAGMIACHAAALAQQTESLPDAPSALLPATSSSGSSGTGFSNSEPGNVAPGDDSGQQTKGGQPAAPAPQTDQGPSKRLLGIIPNFRSVRTTVVLPPQTVKDKFIDASEDTFDYSAVALFVSLAGYSYGTNATPEFGSGGLGYARYLWHAAADQTIENYIVEFIIPVIAHEDTRFYQLGQGGFRKRTFYAVSRTFVTKSDKDKKVFNAGEVVGALASSSISRLYYPSPERSGGQILQNYGTNLFIDAASYFVREFEPEITRALSRHKSPPQ